MVGYSLSIAGKMLGVDPKTFKSWLTESHIEPETAPDDKRIKLITDTDLKKLAQRYHRTIKKVEESEYLKESVDEVQIESGVDEHTKIGALSTTQVEFLREIVKDALEEYSHERERVFTQKLEPIHTRLNELAQSIQGFHLDEPVSNNTESDMTIRVPGKLPRNGDTIAGVKIRIYEKLVAKDTATQLAEAHGANPKANWEWTSESRNSVKGILECVWINLHDPLSLHKRTYPKYSWDECNDLRCDCHEIAKEHLLGVTERELQKFQERHK